MKKMIIVLVCILIIILCVAILSATGGVNLDIKNPPQDLNVDPSGSTVPATEEITLAVGETRNAAGLNITFNSFVQDNRCGIDILCPEAGGVTVNVTLQTEDETVTRNMASDEAPF